MTKTPDSVVIDRPYSDAPYMELRRAQTAPPPGGYYGWYYGRRNTGYKAAPYPILVISVASKPDVFGRFIFNMGGKSYETTSDFDWFGPVPVCVEAGT